MIKFASKMRAETLADLRAYAAQERLSIAEVIDTAVSRHLQLVRVRPDFNQLVEEIIDEDRELLSRLAK